MTEQRMCTVVKSVLNTCKPQRLLVLMPIRQSIIVFKDHQQSIRMTKYPG